MFIAFDAVGRALWTFAYFALGYGGNGMTASFLAAKTLVAMYQQRDTANLFAFDRARR